MSTSAQKKSTSLMEIIIVHTIIIISDNFLLFWVKVDTKKHTRGRKRSIIHCDKIGDAYFDNFNVWKQKSYKQIQVPKFLMFQVLELTTDDCKKISKKLMFELSTRSYVPLHNKLWVVYLDSLWMIQFQPVGRVQYSLHLKDSSAGMKI